MSRYEVEALDPEHYTVIVGWDNPLSTFYAQVWDLTLEADDDEACVLWIGVHARSVTNVTTLAQAVSAYAVLPADTVTRLEQDQVDAKPPTRLQQWVQLHCTEPMASSSLCRQEIDNGPLDLRQ